MPMPRDSFQADVENNIVKGWRVFINNLEKSLDLLDQHIDEAAQMAETCTSEWCQATEHVIDEIANSLFSISEPHWSSEEDSKKIKELKRRVHDLYAKYKSTAVN